MRGGVQGAPRRTCRRRRRSGSRSWWPPRPDPSGRRIGVRRRAAPPRHPPTPPGARGAGGPLVLALPWHPVGGHHAIERMRVASADREQDPPRLVGLIDECCIRSSTSAKSFFRIVRRAIIAIRAAPAAADRAAYAPPPGVAASEASTSSHSVDAVVPPSSASSCCLLGQTFQDLSGRGRTPRAGRGRRPPGRAPPRGTSPTISESTDRHAAVARRRDDRVERAPGCPVTSWSTRFIETVTQPRSGTANPIARTAGSPPEDSRISAGDLLRRRLHRVPSR